MAAIQMKELLEAGVHFGHQTKRWNPKMKKYIFGAREQHLHHRPAEDPAPLEPGRQLPHQGRQRRQDLPVRRHQAPGPGADRRAGPALRRLLREQPLAGRHAHQLRHHQEVPGQAQGDRGHPERSRPAPPTLSKKEILTLTRAKEKLEASFAGIRDMRAVPDVIFVIDPHREDIAVTEAVKLGIKLVGLVDTNCDPDKINYVIPANDDAIRSILLFSERVADSILEGPPVLPGQERQRRHEGHDGREDGRRRRSLGCAHRAVRRRPRAWLLAANTSIPDPPQGVTQWLIPPWMSKPSATRPVSA